MPRILLLIILGWLLYVVSKRFIAKIKPNEPTKTDDPEAEKVVACSQCGVHIPENESRLIGDVTVCNNPSCQEQAK